MCRPTQHPSLKEGGQTKKITNRLAGVVSFRFGLVPSEKKPKCTSEKEGNLSEGFPKSVWCAVERPTVLKPTHFTQNIRCFSSIFLRVKINFGLDFTSGGFANLNQKITIMRESEKIVVGYFGKLFTAKF